MVEEWWRSGGEVVEEWWRSGEGVVEEWWSGGEVVEEWWKSGGVEEWRSERGLRDGDVFERRFNF